MYECMYALLSGFIQFNCVNFLLMHTEMENTLRKDREHKEHLAQQKAKLGDEIDVDDR